MKQLFLLVFSFSLALTACSKKSDAVSTDDAKEEATAAAAAPTISINAADSKVYWVGSKLAGKHDGYIPVKSGELSIENGNISAGKFVMDVAGLTVTDLEGEKKANLEGHLKNADFFEVETYPTAEFVVTDSRKVEASDSGITHQITGNLTMHGKTKSITIPATVSTDGGFSAVTPEFVINRTDWDVKYASGLLGTAKDKMINDDVQIKIELKG